jgi:hypothetical protein
MTRAAKVVSVGLILLASATSANADPIVINFDEQDPGVNYRSTLPSCRSRQRSSCLVLVLWLRWRVPSAGDALRGMRPAA